MDSLCNTDWLVGWFDYLRTCAIFSVLLFDCSSIDFLDLFEDDKYLRTGVLMAETLCNTGVNTSLMMRCHSCNLK